MYRSMSEVTNDNSSRSSSIDEGSMNSDENFAHKQKPRHVRSIIKTSVNKILVDAHPKQTINTRRCSMTSTTDKRPFPFGQCRVCMDKATGAHYGVPTCEGCKGFFKRSILRKEKYRCYFGDRCIVTTDNRNRCKSCRFQKCLKEGMSVEGVRMGRIPKLVKEKALAEHHLSSSSTENDDPSSSMNFPSTDFELQLIDEQLFLDDIASISFDHLPAQLPSCASCILSKNSSIDEEEVDYQGRILPSDPTADWEEQFSNNILERIMKFVTKMSQTMFNTDLNAEESAFIRYLRRKIINLSSECNEQIRQLIKRMKTMINLQTKEIPDEHPSIQDILTGLTDAIPFHVKNLITFARETPAIKDIELDDFQKIMNNRLFDFWLIKHSPLIRNNESYLMLPNGLQYTRQWMVKVLGEEMVDTMFNFAKRFNALDLTIEEQALILPVIICFKDNTLDDPETVQRIQYCYLYALYAQMLTTRTQSEAKTVFRSLLQIFALLPFLNELQEKRIGSLIPETME